MFPIPDTNLRSCHGSSVDSLNGQIDCPGVVDTEDCGGDEYCGQDAQYGWDSTHDSDARFVLAGAQEGAVLDALTQLEWQACSAGQTGSACGGEGTLQTWHEAVSYCEDLDWGGQSDWRLPDSYETHSIIDFSRTSPALDSTAFPNAPSLFDEEYDQWWIDCVWTSSIYSGDSAVSLVMMLNSGDISSGSGLEYHLNDHDAAGWDGCSARCVRGGAAQPTFERFLVSEPVSDEPMVIDTRGHRIWQGCSAGQSGPNCTGEATMMDWKSALSYCQSLDWAGSQQWRLPDIKELFSIVDLGTRSPAIDSSAFPNTPFYG
ncbi:MAG: DUF1566 domain-containing protein, partial [Myxococcota bacterium]|nr:DUF1566 domain-containing protein [Myxococcota bacterium]